MQIFKSYFHDYTDIQLSGMFDEYLEWCSSGVLVDGELRKNAERLKEDYSYSMVSALQTARESFLYECALRWKAKQC